MYRSTVDSWVFTSVLTCFDSFVSVPSQPGFSHVTNNGILYVRAYQGVQLSKEGNEPTEEGL